MTTIAKCNSKHEYRSNRILSCTREPGHAGKHSAAGVVWQGEVKK